MNNTNVKRVSVEFLYKFHCVEDPEYLYEANKGLYGNLEEYLKFLSEDYNKTIESDESEF